MITPRTDLFFNLPNLGVVFAEFFFSSSELIDELQKPYKVVRVTRKTFWNYFLKAMVDEIN